jgi:predicted small lipoprotein YifL
MKRVIAATLVLAVLVALALTGCGTKPEPLQGDIKALDQGKDVSAKASALVIKLGIQSYIATNSVAPPAATPDVLGSFVSPWPNNPFTHTAMTTGTQPGDYSYTPLTGTNFQLTVTLADGSTYTP